MPERRREGGGTCPACGAAGVTPFYRVPNVPVHSVLLMRTRELALGYPRGDIALGFCRACGFVSNLLFDPGAHEYSDGCEETQAFSPRFGEFHRRLAEHLVERYDLRGKDIAEIGCGKGEFLALLCELGGNRGVGYDPAYREDRPPARAAPRLSFVRDFYSEKHGPCGADFVCCKMTLEHIGAVGEFVGMLRRTIRAGAVAFFQVPDAARILAEGAFWDVYYEHPSYFGAASLGRLFRRSGFEVLDLRRGYGGQYLMLEARAGGVEEAGEESDFEEMSRDADSFAERCRAARERWSRLLAEGLRRGERAVVWGSGSKAVAFLAAVDPGGAVEYVVDINPYRQGTYVTGTGQEIVAPSFLARYRPDTVVVMNPIYEAEIRRDLERMGLEPRLLAVGATESARSHRSQPSPSSVGSMPRVGKGAGGGGLPGEKR